MIIIVTIFVKFISLIKEILIAKTFGTSSQIEAYIFALLLATFLSNCISYSAIPSFMPTYLKLYAESKIKAKILCEEIVGKLIIINLIICILLYIFGPMVVDKFAVSMSLFEKNICKTILFLLIPLTLFDGLTIFISSLFEAHGKFFLTTLLPVVKNLFLLIYLSLTKTHFNIIELSVFWLLGSICSLIIIIIFVYKENLFVKPSFKNNSKEVKFIFFQYLPVAFSALIYSGVPFVDQTMAITIAKGSLATINYGEKLIGLTHGILGPAVANAALPFFSKLVINQNWTGIIKSLKFYLILIFFCSLILILFVYFFRFDITRILFERGSFSKNDTKNVGTVFFLYIFQTPFFLGTMLLLRLLSSINKNKYLLIGTLISLILNFSLNLYLIPKMGVNGIALSTSITFLISFVYYSTIIKIVLVDKIKL